MHPKWPNIWHLRVFRIAMETANLSVAASRLQLSQPAVSQALVGLESYFGAPLTRREHGCVFPTPAGELLSDRSGRTLEFLTAGLRDASVMSQRQAIQMIRTLSASRLEALASIVRHGGFAPAARSLGVAAPTLHRAARELERSLGIDLFEATSFGVRPSRKADMIANAAALAFAEIRQAVAEIEALKGTRSGRTCIGAMPLARSHLVPVSVEAFSRTHPAHLVTILDGAYDDLLSGLRRGEIDFLVGALRDDFSLKDVIQEELFTDQLALVMRAGHPLAGAGRLSMSKLQPYSWIAPRMESPLRRHFESLFLADGPPVDVIECNSLGATRVILMNSDRIALLSDAQIRYEKQSGMLISRPAPGPVRKRIIGMTRRLSWRPTAAQRDLVETLKVNSLKNL